MSLSDHPKAYGTAAIVFAFTAGVFATLGLKERYPELERRYQHDKSSNGRSTDRRRGSLFWSAPVKLEDHERKLPPPPNEESPPDVIQNHMEWRTEMQDLNRQLWEATKVMESIQNEFVNRPTIYRLLLTYL